MVRNDKIGVGIVTYNSEDYYKSLYNSIKDIKIDCLVTVNGGNPYTNKYTEHWIQHDTNKYPAACRNDAITFLLQNGCTHLFIIEDDMIIKRKDVFERYVQTSQVSGLKYFSFVSTSWDSGTPKQRTPRLVVEYSKDISVSFYKNMCNEFTYHHRSCFDKVGLYDTQFRDPFDIDMAYRESQQDYASPFWWFADITDSDMYIENNPVAVSRLQGARSDGSREQRIQEQWGLFVKKHRLMVNQIADRSKEDVIKKLKQIKL